MHSLKQSELEPDKVMNATKACEHILRVHLHAQDIRDLISNSSNSVQTDLLSLDERGRER